MYEMFNGIIFIIVYSTYVFSDLSFAKGDVVLLRKQVDENWYHGELNGHQGFFPATYVQVRTGITVNLTGIRASSRQLTFR